MEVNMGYRTMKPEELFEIWSRLIKGHSRRRIAQERGLDRKTVNEYAARILKLSIPAGTSYTKAIEILSQVCKENRKPQPSQTIFSLYQDEIQKLLEGEPEKLRLPMKAITVWEVLVCKYELDQKTSYQSFTRFIRTNGLIRAKNHPVIRIEQAWGEELQLDYARMGLWIVDGKSRIIYAYIAILSASRLPFILFTTSQDEASFAYSTVKALEFYGGTTKYLNLDNLKAGILKPQLYDPLLNRTFAELCDHYGLLADPARVAHPKDKGKVERFVQVAKEAWKFLTYIHPEESLDNLNEDSMDWCRSTYGARRHGTTGLKPWEAFKNYEKEVLGPLPAVPYTPSRWSYPKVHPDQFITVDHKLYGLPASLIGKNVAVRSTESFVQIYFEHKLVRSYTVPKEARRAYLPEDFPPYAQPFSQGSYAAWLRRQAEALSPQAGHYIGQILENSGNLGIRRAQGCLRVLEKYKSQKGFSHVLGKAIAQHVFSPDRLKAFFAEEEGQIVFPIVLSLEGKAMGREASYYTGS